MVSIKSFPVIKSLYGISEELNKKIVERMIDLFENTGKNIVLDAPCARGYIAGKIIEKNSNAKYIGLDIDKSMLKIARKKFPDLTFLNADIRKIPLQDESVNAIISLYVFDIIPKNYTPKILNEFSRILKKEGKLVIATLVNLEDEIKERFDKNIVEKIGLLRTNIFYSRK